MNPEVITLNSNWSISITYSEKDRKEILLFHIIHKTGEIYTELDIPFLRWNYLKLQSMEINKSIQDILKGSTTIDRQFGIGGGLEIRVSSRYDYVHMCMFHRNYIINKIVPIGPELQMPFEVWNLLWDKVHTRSNFDHLICMTSKDHVFAICSECNPYSFMDCYVDRFIDLLDVDLKIPWSMVERKEF